MALAEKFGWSVPMAKSLESLPDSYPDPSAHNFEDLIWIYRSRHDHVADCAVLAGEFQQATRSAREVVRASLDHFFGGWRQTSREKPREKAYDWFCNAPNALFWAAEIGAWDAVVSLSRFPCVPRSGNGLTMLILACWPFF